MKGTTRLINYAFDEKASKNIRLLLLKSLAEKTKLLNNDKLENLDCKFGCLSESPSNTFRDISGRLVRSLTEKTDVNIYGVITNDNFYNYVVFNLRLVNPDIDQLFDLNILELVLQNKPLKTYCYDMAMKNRKEFGDLLLDGQIFRNIRVLEGKFYDDRRYQRQNY